MKMKGRVIKSTGSWYKVALNNQNSVNARLKGNLRLMGSRSTNPIAVGDFGVLNRIKYLEPEALRDAEEAEVGDDGGLVLGQVAEHLEVREERRLERAG